MDLQSVDRAALRRIVEGHGLSVVFQPIADLGPGCVVGFEALSRFAGGSTPDVWFARAEEMGLREELELAAIRSAIARLDEVPSEVYVSINVSPDTATSEGFAILMRGAPLDRLMIELTEHAQVTDYDGLATALTELRTLGARLAIDDVGAGFSSMSHILRLHPDVIKLDVGFTRGIDSDTSRRALVAALVAFAGAIDCRVIAEGIETPEELEALTDLGVRFGQGYLLGRPKPHPTTEIDPAEHPHYRPGPAGWGMAAFLAAIVESAHTEAVYEAPRVHRLRRAIAVVTAAILVVGAPATIALADNSAPGSRLWWVKTHVEDLRLAAARDPDDRLRLELEFAGRRELELDAIPADPERAGLFDLVGHRLERHLTGLEHLLRDDEIDPSMRAAALRSLDAVEAVTAATCARAERGCASLRAAHGRATSLARSNRNENARTEAPAPVRAKGERSSSKQRGSEASTQDPTNASTHGSAQGTRGGPQGSNRR